MADEQSRTGAKETTKSILNGVLIAIISGITGYYINDYLSKDNIRIEQVDFVSETNKFLLSEEDYKFLKKF